MIEAARRGAAALGGRARGGPGRARPRRRRRRSRATASSACAATGRAARRGRARPRRRPGRGRRRADSGAAPAAGEPPASARLLALAFPDRIAKARGHAPGEFLHGERPGGAARAARPARARRPSWRSPNSPGAAGGARILLAAAARRRRRSSASPATRIEAARRDRLRPRRGGAAARGGRGGSAPSLLGRAAPAGAGRRRERPRSWPSGIAGARHRPPALDQGAVAMARPRRVPARRRRRRLAGPLGRRARRGRRRTGSRPSSSARPASPTITADDLAEALAGAAALATCWSPARRRGADPFRGADRLARSPVDYAAAGGPGHRRAGAGTVRPRRTTRRWRAAACR